MRIHPRKLAAVLAVAFAATLGTLAGQVLGRYAKAFGADAAGWRFLRESPATLEPVLSAYDEWTRLLPKGEIDHPARVYLIDARGNIREIYSLAFFNDKQALLDMKKLLSEARP